MTPTIVVLPCLDDFGDSRSGLRGTSFEVGAPQARNVYIQIDKSSGDARNVSDREFEAACQRAPP